MQWAYEEFNKLSNAGKLIALGVGCGVLGSIFSYALVAIGAMLLVGALIVSIDW